MLYSDKSESSVDDMMEDTPSNYNIANGRLEGKSMGLKAILLYAKNQGIKVGETTNPLPQINEEGLQNAVGRNAIVNSSGEQRNWGNVNQPVNGINTQVIGNGLGEDVNRTLDDGRMPKSRTKRNPGAKQFLEPGD